MRSKVLCYSVSRGVWSFRPWCGLCCELFVRLSVGNVGVYMWLNAWTDQASFFRMMVTTEDSYFLLNGVRIRQRKETSTSPESAVFGLGKIFGTMALLMALLFIVNSEVCVMFMLYLAFLFWCAISWIQYALLRHGRQFTAIAELLYNEAAGCRTAELTPCVAAPCGSRSCV